mgnify:CR=1 FL=1
MHQTLLVVDAFFKGNHGFCTVNTLNIVKLKNHVFSMLGIMGPDFTEYIEFTGCHVCNGNVWYLIYSF